MPLCCHWEDSLGRCPTATAGFFAIPATGLRRARLISWCGVQPRHAEACLCLVARYGVHGHTSTHKLPSVPSTGPRRSGLMSWPSVQPRHAEAGSCLAGLSGSQCPTVTAKSAHRSPPKIIVANVLLTRGNYGYNLADAKGVPPAHAGNRPVYTVNAARPQCPPCTRR